MLLELLDEIRIQSSELDKESAADEALWRPVQALERAEPTTPRVKTPELPTINPQRNLVPTSSNRLQPSYFATTQMVETTSKPIFDVGHLSSVETPMLPNKAPVPRVKLPVLTTNNSQQNLGIPPLEDITFSGNQMMQGTSSSAVVHGSSQMSLPVQSLPGARMGEATLSSSVVSLSSGSSPAVRYPFQQKGLNLYRQVMAFAEVEKEWKAANKDFERAGKPRCSNCLQKHPGICSPQHDENPLLNAIAEGERLRKQYNALSHKERDQLRSKPRPVLKDISRLCNLCGFVHGGLAGCQIPLCSCGHRHHRREGCDVAFSRLKRLGIAKEKPFARGGPTPAPPEAGDGDNTSADKFSTFMTAVPETVDHNDPVMMGFASDVFMSMARKRAAEEPVEKDNAKKAKTEGGNSSRRRH